MGPQPRKESERNLHGRPVPRAGKQKESKKSHIGNERNTVLRVLSRKRELNEFGGKLGEFGEKLNEFAHK